MRTPRDSAPGWTTGARTLALAVALLAALSGCGNYFDAYRGVDLITARGLTMDDWAVAYQVPDADAAVDYIRLQPVTAANAGSTAGLPAGAEDAIYLLEVPNLIPDGDFEASTVGVTPNGWDASLTGGGSFAVEAAGAANGITGQTVYFDITSPEYARLPLPSTMTDGLHLDGWYAVTLDFRRGQASTEITFDYADDDNSLLDESRSSLGWNLTAIEGATETPVETFPTPPENNNGNDNLAVPNGFEGLGSAGITGMRYFYVGGPGPVSFSPQTGWVDNVRISRLDVGAHMALELPQVTDADADEDGATDTFPFYAGDYVFSLHVKALPDALVSPETPNSFHAPQIVLGANGQLSTSFAQTEEEWSADQWVEVSAIVTITNEELETDTPLTLMLSVIDPQQLTVPNYTASGGLLIAQPRLELYQP